MRAYAQGPADGVVHGRHDLGEKMVVVQGVLLVKETGPANHLHFLAWANMYRDWGDLHHTF